MNSQSKKVIKHHSNLKRQKKITRNDKKKEEEFPQATKSVIFLKQYPASLLLCTQQI